MFREMSRDEAKGLENESESTQARMNERRQNLTDESTLLCVCLCACACVFIRYRGVAKSFSETFVQLVGEAGHGELIMIRDAKPGGGYAGVSCRVSFGGEETKRMEQLSGGQKSLVALCLILSIQRIDRAPFYLFDEVDAALDENYRGAVANVLAQRANEGAQFITTTFHPEQVLISDQCYGVTFKNKVSTVDLIDREEAMKFVTQKV